MRNNGRRSRQSQDSPGKLRFVRQECVEILIVVVYLFNRPVISLTTARLIASSFKRLAHFRVKLGNFEATLRACNAVSCNK